MVDSPESLDVEILDVERLAQRFEVG